MSSLSPLNGKNPELGGFSIGYVQFITSEPTDNQVSSFSLVGTISFTVMSSLSPLNGRNRQLGGFSIGYVHITSEPTDNQVSSFSPVGTIP